MAEISKITLPSGNTYDIKDATAREMISGGVSFIIAWDGTSTPTVANIPAGVVVKYNGTNYTGTLAASSAEAGAFYLVKSGTAPSSETLDVYDEYVPVGVTGNKTWEKIGDTQLNLTDVVTGVSLTKQTDVVLGEATTFTSSTPTITVTPSTTNIKATASGTAVGANGTAQAITGFGNHTKDTFVKAVTAETGKNLVTTTVPNVTGNTSVTIPNVTDVGAASTWNFKMGETAETAETLIISGSNSTAPTLGTALSASKVTLGTAKTVATGATSTTGTGDAVVTDVTIGDSAQAITALGTPTTATALTGVKVTTQPTVALATGATAGTGVISVVTGISSASSTQPSITVGTNDKVTVLKNTTDVSVTKGNA